MKKALITGITGMDGSYLAELLLSKGYEVHGIQRPSSSINTGRIDHIYDRLHMHYADMTDTRSITRVVQESQPDEIYNLAAQSHVRISFDLPDYTREVNEYGCTHVMHSFLYSAPIGARLYQASSSEMFGNASIAVQSEVTPFDPCSPYGESKFRSFRHVQKSRESHRKFALNGILFNHTSERQKETFITRKISKGAARIKLGLQDKLFLGNIEAKRDIGYAPDYMEAVWLMMQQDQPDDYVIATGESHSISEILDEAFGYLGLNWTDHVEIDPRLYRPTELHSLCGDASKAQKALGWEPKHSFKEIVRKMVDADVQSEGRKRMAALPMMYDTTMHPRGLPYTVNQQSKVYGD